MTHFFIISSFCVLGALGASHSSISHRGTKNTEKRGKFSSSILRALRGSVRIPAFPTARTLSKGHGDAKSLARASSAVFRVNSRAILPRLVAVAAGAAEAGVLRRVR